MVEHGMLKNFENKHKNTSKKDTRKPQKTFKNTSKKQVGFLMVIKRASPAIEGRNLQLGPWAYAFIYI